MAPVKFGLFRGRSKDHPDPPSTENLLHSSICSNDVATPSSPIPSTSKGFHIEDRNGFSELSTLTLDSDDEEESEKLAAARRNSTLCMAEEGQINYKPLPSTNATSTTTLQDSLQDLQDLHNFQEQLDEIQNYDLQKYEIQKYELASPDDATSIDANSLQFDETSITSEDVKYCGATKKQKRNKAKEELQIQAQQKDLDMWKASNYQVLQHLLSRSGTLDEQIKWEAIATARGLCTLTAACTCGDCSGGKSPSCVTDGDGGLGAAPLFSAVSVGCEIM